MSFRTSPYELFAIDPGQSKAGFAWFQLQSPRHRDDLRHQCDCVTHSADGLLRLLFCINFPSPALLIEFLETNLRRADTVVCERFQLYPWMARQQGFSEFGTAETIGVIKYLCGRLRVPYVPQDAARSKKDGRTWGVKAGFPMVERKLGSGRWTYYGPDIDLPGLQDRRDAWAHGMTYLCGSGRYRPKGS